MDTFKFRLVWNKRFDPSFFALQLITAIEAIFLSTLVLISHKITRLITLVGAIAKKLEIEEVQDPEINELSKDVLQ